MRIAHNSWAQVATPPASVADGGNNSATSIAIDTVHPLYGKANHCYIILQAGAVATTGGTAVAKLQECATYNGTYADISGTDLGGSWSGTIDNGCLVWSVPLGANRLRFLNIAFTNGTGGTSVVGIVAHLFSPPGGIQAASDMAPAQTNPTVPAGGGVFVA